MHVNKKAEAKLMSLHRYKVLFTVFSGLLICVFFVQQAKANTNGMGEEVEVISDEVKSDLTGDPIQTLISNVDSTDTNQNDLWGRIKDGYAMPDMESEYTANHEAWYAARPDYVKRMVERSQKYLFHIVEEVQKRGMPTEIALLPMVESAFNPQAYSRSKASGIWQFVPSTGKDFGLKQNWWVDNRRDVTAATSAALNYLQKLHGMFGTWELALAAYNAGEGTVQRAIERNRRQGLPTDYQSLDLPIETKNYVPKLQAIKNIVTDPEKFGLTINSIPNQPYFSRVKAPKQIDAKLAAQLAEISPEEFSSLNPSYNRPVITSQGEVHQFLLPTWAAERFTNNLENYNKPLTSWQTYSVKRGERMDNIAKKFGINVSQFRNVNGLSDTKKFRTTQAVLVPASFSTHSQPIQDEINDNTDNINTVVTRDENAKLQIKSHKVKKGETLTDLADKYNTSSTVLMQINHLKSSKIRAGQVIKLTTKSSNRMSRRSASDFRKVKVNRKVKIAKNQTRNLKSRARTRLS
ncbi:MAG: transglycosylase SLT domain-containing protein [Methylophilaceae bacterium]